MGRVVTARRTLASGALGLALLIGGCFVDRRSEDFECTTSDTCSDGRVCDQGFCVPVECPSECNAGCDVLAKTCGISCATGSCPNVSCPSGYACTIDCSRNNACSNIDCTEAASCTIACSGVATCTNIDCGPGACDVTCTGNNACTNLDCASSCACDVSCTDGVNCPNASCPSPGGMECTEDGTPLSPCSSADAGCSSC